jgi:hypothetical protein
MFNYNNLFAAIFLWSFFFITPVSAQQNELDSAAHSGLRLDLVTLGDDTRIVIAPICKTPMQGIWFVHVHEDENTAVLAASEFLDSAGKGCFVTLKHGMGRNINFNLNNVTYKFDPNRIYTPEGRKATLKRFGQFSDSAYEAVTHLSNLFTRKYIDSNRLIVALHNNTDEGGLTIKSYQKGGPYARDASKVFVNKKEDVDDFLYTTSERAFDFFRKRGFNVMLQNNDAVTDDGSLSVYAGMNKMDYINIEAEHGKKDQQKRMIAAVMAYIEMYYMYSIQKP